MTDDRAIDVTIERAARSWLEVGPTSAPERAVEAALERIDHTTQERGFRAPWRFPPMTTLARVAVLATVGALLIAGLALLGVGSSRTSPSVAPTVGPSAISDPMSPPPTSNLQSETALTGVRTPSPLSGSTHTFAYPFSYELPADAGIVVSGGPSNVIQFRIPTPGTEDQYGSGVAVRTVTGGREDPCTDSPDVPIGPGPQAVVDYLLAIPTLDVSATEALTVDGKPAVRFTMTPHGPTDSCADLRLWSGSEVYTRNASWSTAAEVTVVDVRDSHIVILVFGDDAWRDIAHELIESIDFTE